MFRNRILKVLGNLILLAVFCTGQVSAAPSQAPNAVMDWTISGTIYGGSNRLPNAVINFNDAGTGSNVGTATTDSNGFYNIAVNDGAYNMTIIPPNGSGFSDSVVNGIVVSGGNVTQNVVLISQAFTISGVVRYPDGTLAQNILVEVLGLNGAIGGSVKTDANGAYTIPVSPGTFNLKVNGGTEQGSQAKPSPYRYWYYPVFNLIVTENMTQDIVLPPFVTVSGKITDPNDIAVGNARLYTNYAIFTDSNGISIHTSSDVNSDMNGVYSMVVIPYSNYSFTAVPPNGRADLVQTSYNGISVTADTVRDFFLTSSIIVSGVIRYSDGTPAQNILVGGKKTTSNGVYSISVSPGSTFNLRLYGGTEQGIQTKPSPFKYTYDPISNLLVTESVIQDIILPPFVTISGKITDANEIIVGNARLGRGATASFTDPNGKPVSMGAENVYSDITTGAYNMIVIPGGAYTFYVNPPIGGRIDLLQTSYTGVSITADTVRDFAFAATKLVSGVVRYPDGTVAPNINVYSNSTIGGSGMTDVNGAYVFPVRPGTFSLKIYGGTIYGSQARPSPYWYNYEPVVSNFVVTENATQDIILLPFVTIGGKTTDANGVAVGNVRLYRPSTWFFNSNNQRVDMFYESVYSNVAGAYSMVIFPYNNYSFTAYPPSGSGFLQTTVNNINISTNILQNWIMALPDTTAPFIISGPTVTNITDSAALVQWQTSEPARGGVKYGKTNPPGTTLSETNYVVTHSQLLTGLSADTLYYTSVFASDKSGNGPVPSSVVSFHTTALADATPPVIIEGPTISAITQQSAIVTWKTNEPTTGVLSYGMTTAFGQTVTDNTLATSHSVTLSGLNAETLYYLKVSATDTASNGPTDSAMVNFRTVAAPDAIPPIIIEGPMAINITATSAIIVWKTDEPATSGVSLNNGTIYKVYSDDTLTTFHSALITGLSPSTTYTYVVSSKDAFGNGPALSAAKTFTTLSAPDMNPPVFIECPLIVNVTHQSAVIRCKTDEPADALIEFGTTPVFGSSEARVQLVTNQNIPLTGLLPGTLYYFRISSKDAASNGPTISDTYTFTTDVQSNNKAPVITAAPQIVYSSDTKATVLFETDIPCDTVIEYGQGSNLTNRQSNSEKVNAHQITLTNLTPNTSYDATISCTDMAGNTMVAGASQPHSTFKLARLANPILFSSPAAMGFSTNSLPDTIPPVITGAPIVTPISATQSIITWNTDGIADSLVTYHVSGQTVDRTAGDIIQVSNHSIALTNLTPLAEYQFTVTSFDPSGNQATSGVFSFTNNAPINGVCGSANGKPFTSAPIAYLCNSGILSNMSGTGPWSWACQGINHGDNASCSTINFYSLTYAAGAHGSLTGTSPQTVNHGANGTAITAIPDMGYHFVNWSDGFLNAARTDTNITGNLSVTANFAINTYTIRGNAGVVGATITYTGGATITDNNGNYSFTVDYGWSGTATSFKMNYVFMPMSKSYSNVVADQLQDYIATPVYYSIAINDGWVLESKEFSNVAGTKNNTATTLRVGDDALKRQYRSILYFDTTSLPDKAKITKVTLLIKKSSPTDTLPTTLGDLVADIKKGFFGLNKLLELSDFNALAEPVNTGKLVETTDPDWYQLKINPLHFKYINVFGATQFRLRFTKDDNNDSVADFISFYAGNAVQENQPQLMIEYYVP